MTVTLVVNVFMVIIKVIATAATVNLHLNFDQLRHPVPNLIISLRPEYLFKSPLLHLKKS